MKKFDKPFDDYRIGADRLIAVELNPQLGHYQHLFDNPIYYLNSLQFVLGELYRAILGYENCWDRDYEHRQMQHLDFLLKSYADKRQYYIEEIVVGKPFEIFGILWSRGVKPSLKTLHSNHYRSDRNVSFHRGERATARINVLDEPYHVDIEFYDGRCYTVTYMRYLDWKSNKNLRSLDHENPPKRRDSKRETESVKSTSRKDPSEALAANVFSLRQRIKRSYALSKAR